MICPYIPADIEQIEQFTFSYEEGLETFREHKLIEQKKLFNIDCTQCGAFYKDKKDKEPHCHYCVGE